MQACSRHPVQTRNSGGTRFPTALQHVCELGRFGHMDQSEEFWRIAGEKATFLAIPTVRTSCSLVCKSLALLLHSLSLLNLNFRSS